MENYKNIGEIINKIKDCFENLNNFAKKALLNNLSKTCDYFHKLCNEIMDTNKEFSSIETVDYLFLFIDFENNKLSELQEFDKEYISEFQIFRFDTQD